MDNAVTYRYNNINISSIEEFSKTFGTLNNGVRDVFFLRFIGTYNGIENDVYKMDDYMKEISQKENIVYRRVESLSMPVEQKDICFYKQAYSNWISGGHKRLNIACTKSSSQFQESLSEACNGVIELYKGSRMGITSSMVDNYVIKLLFWVDKLFGDSLMLWSEKSKIKIVKHNVVKEQDYLFLYMLTLIGCDVLMLQTSEDIAGKTKFENLSKMVKLGVFAKVNIPVKDFEETASPHTSARPVRKASPGVYDAVPQNNISNGNSAQNNSQQTNILGNNSTENNRRNIFGMRTDNGNINLQRNRNQTTAMPLQSLESEEKSYENLAMCASSIVMIEVYGRGGDVICAGSGIMIGAGGYIVTNYHVVRSGISYAVRIENDEAIYYTDEIIKYHIVFDLAVIRIDKRLTPLPIYKGEKKLVRGQKIIAIGSPLGLFNTVSDGIISAFRKYEEMEMIQFTAPTSAGSSGGAVLNMNGEVVGMVTSGYDAGQNINLAIGYDYISNFVSGFVNS